MSQQALDIPTLPLTGRQLIEASAGTGKTYAVTLLVLRALLERKLSIEAILVVTFTDAATLELMDRIQRRLREALDALETGAHQRSDFPDDNLKRVLQDAPREDSIDLLQAALQNIDRASVYTIHGFCQRALQDSAFASGSPMNVALEPLSDSLLQRLVADYWRALNHSASRDECPWWDAVKLNPDTLQRLAKQALSADQISVEPSAPSAPIKAQLDSVYPTLKTHGLDAVKALEALLHKADSPLSGSKLKKPTVRKMVEAVDSWLQSDTLSPLPEYLADKHKQHAQKLRPSVLQDCIKKGHIAPDFSALAPFETLLDLLDHYELALMSERLQQAFLHIQHALVEHQRQHAVQNFDDLLKNLHQALQGQQRDSLTKQLQQRYKLALIDEFQDTDHRQYAIFNQLFPATLHTHGCITIGDPKQAIYRFRGADLGTYLQARDDCPVQNRYTLSTNYRSSQALIAALNAVYSAHPNPFINPNISYQAIQAAGHADKQPLTEHAQGVKPLVVRHLSDTKANKNAYQDWALSQLLSDIQALIEPARFALGEQGVSTGDIAVLVRTNEQITKVKATLLDAGIGSVSLGNTNVFNSDEVEQLGLWVDALANPQDSRRLKALLLSSLGGLSRDELQRIDQHATELGQWQDKVQRCHQRCVSAGPLPALLLWLREAGTTNRLLKSPTRAGRTLTNLLHLAELLQASGERAPLLLMNRLQQLNDDSPEVLQRLESDQALVKLITMHKSKGLQFPIVFLPFAGEDTAHKEQAWVFDQRQPQHWVLDIGSDKSQQRNEYEKDEADAESQRLLYVALTRAEHRAYLYSQVKGETAWAYLSHGHNTLIKHHSAHIVCESDAPSTAHHSTSPQGQGHKSLPDAPLKARTLQRPLPSAWRVHSYTSLSHGAKLSDDNPSNQQPDYDQQALRQAANASAQPDTGLSPTDTTASPPDALTQALDAFPKGANVGIFLHAILEQIDFTDPHLDAEIQAPLCQQHMIDDEHAAVLPEWLHAIRHATLPDGIRLGQLKRADRLDEMAFFLPVKAHKASVLSGLMQQHGYPCATLSEQQLSGYLKGFIDLCYRHEGRYYVADYKSNHLGSLPAHYQADALHHAMCEHNYYLQAVLYTLALHRLLRQRLADYDYSQHIGGASYLFLRGMRAGSPDGVLHFTPPLSLIDALDQVFTHD